MSSNKGIIEDLDFIKDELAQKNPLDRRIYEVCENFEKPESAEDFLDMFVLPFAKENKCLTDYRQKKRQTLRKIEKAAAQRQKEADIQKRIKNRITMGNIKTLNVHTIHTSVCKMRKSQH